MFTHLIWRLKVRAFPGESPILFCQPQLQFAGRVERGKRPRGSVVALCIELMEGKHDAAEDSLLRFLSFETNDEGLPYTETKERHCQSSKGSVADIC